MERCRYSVVCNTFSVKFHLLDFKRMVIPWLEKGRFSWWAIQVTFKASVRFQKCNLLTKSLTKTSMTWPQSGKILKFKIRASWNSSFFFLARNTHAYLYYLLYQKCISSTLSNLLCYTVIVHQMYMYLVFIC